MDSRDDDVCIQGQVTQDGSGADKREKACNIRVTQSTMAPTLQSSPANNVDIITHAQSVPVSHTASTSSGDSERDELETTLLAFFDLCARGPLDPSVELPTISALEGVSDTFATAWLKPYSDKWTELRHADDTMRLQIRTNMLEYMKRRGIMKEFKRVRPVLRQHRQMSQEDGHAVISKGYGLGQQSFSTSPLSTARRPAERPEEQRRAASHRLRRLHLMWAPLGESPRRTRRFEVNRTEVRDRKGSRARLWVHHARVGQRVSTV
ncbi:hypothetical protein AURDEDRAFT_189078, partial [Auricularia subglabra TFB-10046 SS5]